MARKLIAAALVVMAVTSQVSASGHGPVFGGATPTLGKGGWQFDQAYMGRSTEDVVEQTLRSMISFGVTPRVQLSASVPVPLVMGNQPPMGRMTATMSDAPNVEGTAAWRFHVRQAGHGSRLESTIFVGAAVPTTSARGGIQSAPSVNVAGATGYASRAHYLWAGAGYEKRMARDGDKWGDIAYYSVVYGYRPPALRLDYPKPDLRFFVEAQGEHNGRTRTAGVENSNSGGRVLLVGPTTLLLYKQYGLEGGILFPVYQRVNGTQTQGTLPGRRQFQLLLLAAMIGRPMRIVTTAVLAFLLLAPATASAELRRVQLNVLGMD